jgi:hypothetical protein
MKKMMLALALVLTTVLAAGTAYAVDVTAYAVSWDNIFNGQISVSDSSMTAAPPTDQLQAGSSVNGTSGTGYSNSASVADPVVNQIGTNPVVAAADYSPIGEQTYNYAIGQAQVLSNQTVATYFTYAGPDTVLPSLGDTLIQAVNKAEANVVAPPRSTGGASGHNSSSTLVTVPIEVANGGSLLFQFDAAPYLGVDLSGNVIFDSTVSAKLSAVVTITHDDPNNPGVTITDFTWAPNGSGAGPIAGGDVLLDPFTLNTSRSFVYIPGQASYPVGTVGDLTGAGGDSFAAVTDPLAPGIYNVNLFMSEEADVVANAPTTIPEPGTILLFGAGLLGLAGVSRLRRKRSS